MCIAAVLGPLLLDDPCRVGHRQVEPNVIVVIDDLVNRRETAPWRDLFVVVAALDATETLERNIVPEVVFGRVLETGRQPAVCHTV